jgi:endonuclease YncB( thermonuclease family)
MRVNLLAMLIGIAAALYLLSLFETSREDARLSGRARVIDGDTIEIRGQRIRIFGIDAPEQDQTCERSGGVTWSCGAEATRLLRQLVGLQVIDCQVRTIDVYGRFVARCSAAGNDLAGAMVRSGLAIRAGHHSDYAADEASARSGRLGNWSGSFQNPRDWRAAHHDGGRAAD